MDTLGTAAPQASFKMWTIFSQSTEFQVRCCRQVQAGLHLGCFLDSTFPRQERPWCLCSDPTKTQGTVWQALLTDKPYFLFYCLVQALSPMYARDTGIKKKKSKEKPGSHPKKHLKAEHGWHWLCFSNAKVIVSIVNFLLKENQIELKQNKQFSHRFIHWYINISLNL